MSPINRARPGAVAPPELRAAIREASVKTGIPFDYLVAQAGQESGFNPSARAATSSAAGLYQFVETTWLSMIREHGHKYGVGDIARNIAAGADAAPRVADAETKARILALRDDPRLSAAMAAEYARGNHARLAPVLGREVTPTDLYVAHFLGPGGAARFLEAMRAEPTRPAADLLPDAAAANRGVFFDASGRARGVGEIYGRFAAKFEPEARPGEPEPGSAPGAAAEGTPALVALLRRTALAALSGNVLTPTVIAALAALDLPDSGAARAPGEKRPRPADPP